jgi:hypothetical protein
MPHYTKDLNEIVKALKKASKLHAEQAKKLEKINKDQKTRYSSAKKVTKRKPIKKKK